VTQGRGCSPFPALRGIARVPPAGPVCWVRQPAGEKEQQGIGGGLLRACSACMPPSCGQPPWGGGRPARLSDPCRRRMREAGSGRTSEMSSEKVLKRCRFTRCGAASAGPMMSCSESDMMGDDSPLVFMCERVRPRYYGCGAAGGGARVCRGAVPRGAAATMERMCRLAAFGASDVGQRTSRSQKRCRPGHTCPHLFILLSPLVQ
jgi:hypothetical protein